MTASDRLWIGGGTDAGKTTVARILALTHTLALYECDGANAAHHAQLAEQDDDIAAFLSATVDERWLKPAPQDLADRSLRSFAARWPMILQDLKPLARRGRPVLAEGFDLTPELVAAVEPDLRRAVWLVPSEAFKRRSWEARRKPGFKDQASDPEAAAANLWARDLALTQIIRDQAGRLGGAIIEVDGSKAPDRIAAELTERFRPFLRL